MHKQTALERLAELMRVHVRRDECGDQVIQGRTGNVHEDGKGFSVAVMLRHGRSLHVALVKLAGFCQVRQLGETEAVLHMASTPPPEQAATLREVLGVRKIRQVSPEEVERLRKMGFKPTLACDGDAINRPLDAQNEEIPAMGRMLP